MWDQDNYLSEPLNESMKKRVMGLLKHMKNILMANLDIMYRMYCILEQCTFQVMNM